MQIDPLAMTSTKPLQKRLRLRIGERRNLVVIGDFLMGLIALGFAIWFWAGAEAQQLQFYDFIRTRLQWWFFLLPLAWLMLLIESYDGRRTESWRRTLRSIALAALIGLFAYSLIYFYSDPRSLPRRGVAGFLLAAAFLTTLWRMLYIRIFTAPAFMHRAVLVGAGSTGMALLNVIESMDPPPFELAGLIDDDPEKVGQTILSYMVFGGHELLLELVEKEHISDIIVAISGKMEPEMFRALIEAQTQGIEITRMPVAYEEMIGRVPVHHLEADWILRNFVDDARVSAFYRMGKRLMDIIGGLVGIMILVVIGPLIALAISLEDGRPIVFEQTRAGLGGQPYRILKFRSMRRGAEVEGQPQLASENDDRATKVGRFLRKTHLDEWLQFINVLRGEMSLVGPRPERPELVERFQQEIPFYRGRLLTKPGIAGWAQVHFDYASTLDEMVMKLEYDLYYIKHRSIWMDIIILLRTVAAVIGFRGR